MNNEMIARYGRFVANALWIIECFCVLFIYVAKHGLLVKTFFLVIGIFILGRFIMSWISNRFYENYALFCYVYFILSVPVAIVLSIRLQSMMFLIILFFLQWLIVLFFMDKKISVGLLMIQTVSLFIILAWKVFIQNSDYNINVREMIFYTCCMALCNWIVAGLIQILTEQQKQSNNQRQSLDDLLQIVESICDEAKNTADNKKRFIDELSNSIHCQNRTIHSMNELIGREQDIRKIHEYSEIIAEKEKSIARMTEQTSIYMKLEEGVVIPQEIRYDFGEMLKDIIVDIYGEAKRKKLSFMISIGDDLERTLVGDRRIVERVIRVLLTNAIQYTDRGVIDVDIYRGNELSDDNRTQICVDVRDTGHGIKHKDIQNIFVPFYRVEEYNAHNSHNAGLGLSIATRYASMLGGNISVESEYGKGSVFHLNILQKKYTSGGEADDCLFDYLEDVVQNIVNSDETDETGKAQMNEAESVHKEETTMENTTGIQQIDLPPIDGIDWNVAMEYLASKETILVTLDKLNKAGYENANQLRNYYERISSDDKEALQLFQIKVHAIKGNLKMIGALELSEHAKALEYAARDEDKECILANTTQFLNDYTNFIIAVGKIPELVSRNQVIRETFDQQEVLSLLETVIKSMDDFDMELADETMRKLESYDYPENIRIHIERLSDKVLNLDNDGARECVEEIKKISREK